MTGLDDITDDQWDARLTRQDVAGRFWPKVDKHDPSGCWIWRGCRHTFGYGKFYVDGGPIAAHRLVYEWANGPLGDLHIRHTCDTPPCVNPEHLLGGTNQDNIRDRMDRGRSSHHGCPGEANGRALLAKRDVAEIREKYAAGVATQGVLAARFGVSQSTISAVINRDTWKDAS